jgi:hypothetical protein
LTRIGAIGIKKPGSKPGSRVLVDELALPRLLLSRLLALLTRFLLSATTLLAALSGVLLATLLARLLPAATVLAAALALLAGLLLAGLLFTRIHNHSFIGPPTYNETVPFKVPRGLEGKRYTAATELKPRRISSARNASAAITGTVIKSH